MPFQKRESEAMLQWPGQNVETVFSIKVSDPPTMNIHCIVSERLMHECIATVCLLILLIIWTNNIWSFNYNFHFFSCDFAIIKDQSKETHFINQIKILLEHYWNSKLTRFYQGAFCLSHLGGGETCLWRLLNPQWWTKGSLTPQILMIF